MTTEKTKTTCQGYLDELVLSYYLKPTNYCSKALQIQHYMNSYAENFNSYFKSIEETCYSIVPDLNNHNVYLDKLKDF